ncbi:hypothetical protein PQR21_27735 [Paraburkholderia nemoris]|uniref:hypothetical protein n=1 Tax=Paraburkholderia nemoris TaxID=2793076 RepID=UPI0038B6FBD6
MAKLLECASNQQSFSPDVVTAIGSNGRAPEHAAKTPVRSNGLSSGGAHPAAQDCVKLQAVQCEEDRYSTLTHGHALNRRTPMDDLRQAVVHIVENDIELR